MKIFIIISLILITLTAVWIFFTIYAVYSIEEPEYEVLEVRNGYEIREYEPYLVAEVEVKGNQREVLNQGFRILAGYIFGGNTKNESISMTTPVTDAIQNSEKIAMTAPVNDIQTQYDTHVVQFALPKKYTLETLPIPNDNRVKLRQVNSYRAAVLKYTGYATETRVKSKKSKLTELLVRDNIEISGNMNSAQYNPPLSFPFLRRNEIIVGVEYSK